MLRMAIRKGMARVTGLEPATSGVTGRRSNQLSYTRLSLGEAPCSLARARHLDVPYGAVNRWIRVLASDAVAAVVRW